MNIYIIILCNIKSHEYFSFRTVIIKFFLLPVIRQTCEKIYY